MATQQLACEICLEQYDSLKRLPKFLTCFHTFCLSCLQDLKRDRVIHCPSCTKVTIVASQKIEEALKTNFYIVNQLQNDKLSNSATTAKESSAKKTLKTLDSYYWCSSCNITFEKGSVCHIKGHETHPLETEDGKEIVDTHLKALLLTCKSHWNNALSKHQNAESSLKASLVAVQTLEQELRSRIKKNEKKTEKLQKKLSKVAIHLTEQSNTKRSPQELHDLFQTYSKFKTESQDSAKIISGDELAALASVRNAVVSMDIKTSNGEKLVAPLFESAKLNFPVEKSNEHESHLLTVLSFLIVASIQKGRRAASPATLSNSSELEKLTKKTFKVDGGQTKVLGTDPMKSNANRGIRNREQTIAKMAGKFKPAPNTKDREKKSFGSNNAHSHKQEERQHYTQGAYQVPSPSILPSYNNKAFLVFARNGKEYGSIVIKLRPDVAPVMCQQFVQLCMAKERGSYHGTIIYQGKPNTFIMGGRIPGQESLYMADPSPLKKTRGAIFLRLKRDYLKSQCSIVSTDFCIHLGEEKSENSRTSTVFGFVCDGMSVCDAISHIDCDKEHIAIASIGIAG